MSLPRASRLQIDSHYCHKCGKLVAQCSCVRVAGEDELSESTAALSDSDAPAQKDETTIKKPFGLASHVVRKTDAIDTPASAPLPRILTMPCGPYRGARLSDVPTGALQNVLLMPTRKAGSQERLELAIAEELAARRFRRVA